MSTTTTKERPIIMSAPMVLAILEGRKTQTRRVMKVQPSADEGPPIHVGIGNPEIEDRHGELGPGDPVFAAWWEQWHAKCPYGAPGDRLWVRETWGVMNACYGPGGNWVTVGYRAAEGSLRDGDVGFEIEVPEAVAQRYHDEFCEDACNSNDGEMPEGDGFEVFRWRSPIHMPHWVSRIMLEVVGVKVERVRQISHHDALAEGVEYDVSKEDGAPLRRFAASWDTINAKRGYSWASNPWVWVLTFRVLKASPEARA